MTWQYMALCCIYDISMTPFIWNYVVRLCLSVQVGHDVSQRVWIVLNDISKDILSIWLVWLVLNGASSGLYEKYFKETF